MNSHCEFLVSPFIVAIDTREGLPYRFADLRCDARDGRKPLLVRTETRTLASGDYSIVGMEDLVAVERKSVEDCFGTLGGGRERFERELERLAMMDFAAVVIEAEWSEILNDPPFGRRLNPKTIFRSVLAWQQRYVRVHWLMMPGRAAAEKCTYRVLARFWEDRERFHRERTEESHASNSTPEHLGGRDSLCVAGAAGGSHTLVSSHG